MSESRLSFVFPTTEAEKASRANDMPCNVHVLWQAVCRELAQGNLDSALATLARAILIAHAQGDPFESTLAAADRLTRHWHELAIQRERHRRVLESDEREMLSVKGQIEALVDVHVALSQNLLARIIAIAGNRSRIADPVVAMEAITGNANLLRELDRDESQPALPEVGSTAESVLAAEPGICATVATTTDVPFKPRVAVHLLGALRIAIDDQPIERCTSSRARAVFAYLVTHRDALVSRDQLMDQFWRDARPRDARNSLNVALHSFRRACKEASDVSIIVHADGFYSINTDLEVWTDVHVFLNLVERGQQLEAANRTELAIAAYEQALALYQGDFLADCPYEDWSVLMREKLRLLYLDVLDRLSVIYLSNSQFGACVALCQLILARDNCREDAHGRLMIAYARQDQHHLAIRQYQVCIAVLRKELDVQPNAKTSALCGRIRRHEWV